LVYGWIYVLNVFLNKNYDICSNENKLGRFIKVSSILNQEKSGVNLGIEIIWQLENELIIFANAFSNYLIKKLSN